MKIQKQMIFRKLYIHHQKQNTQNVNDKAFFDQNVKLIIYPFNLTPLN